MKLDAAGALLEADVAVPPEPRGLVLFAHGTGSSRLSPRNRLVATQLGAASFATVLTDLLTPEEEDRRFDVDLLAGRLTGILDRLAELPEVRALPVGLFGASTGAAAALLAAAARPQRVRAVVSRGGRPDLAGAHLAGVTAPTLLVVGERDAEVIALNRAAAAQLTGEWALRIVAGAGHLFEEPGALEEVANAARAWFGVHLGRGRDDAGPEGVVMEGGGHA
ncbi:dienelactone hydrolase family protein [Phytohabitans sp. LJ34]|uniref:dienelactone hydrolase family protein n=1 Tax=Phytohabitans sp. LJ34 TaxID=3452217 RepID=UPI003F8A1F27